MKKIIQSRKTSQPTGQKTGGGRLPRGKNPRGPVVKDAALAPQRSKVRFLARAVENSQLF